MAKKPIQVETLTHDATGKNIPIAGFEGFMREQDKTPIPRACERRNKDLDPQLVWRGKDMADLGGETITFKWQCRKAVRSSSSVS